MLDNARYVMIIMCPSHGCFSWPGFWVYGIRFTYVYLICSGRARRILKAQALPSLIDIFQELDSDGSGLLTHQEVDNVPLEILPPRVLDSVYVDSMRDIFDLLDVNECGFLTQMEFVEGILNLCLLDMPVATMQNLKLLKIIHDQLVRIEHSVSK